MKILVDENIPLMTVNQLKSMGHDVWDIRGSEDEGSLDMKLWEIAKKNNRLLITTDKGFAQHYEDCHFGMLIIRLRQPNRYRIHERVMLAFNRISDEEWRGMTVTMRDKTMSVIRKKSLIN